jgi:hypothetical protein
MRWSFIDGALLDLIAESVRRKAHRVPQPPRASRYAQIKGRLQCGSNGRFGRAAASAAPQSCNTALTNAVSIDQRESFTR